MKYLIIILTVVSLYACSKKFSPAEYLEYVNTHENEFEITQKTTNKYVLSYIPVDQLLAENTASFSVEELKAEKKNAQEKPVSFFEFKIEVPAGNLFTQNNAPKSEQMAFYSVEFGKRIFAITTLHDTLPCSNYIFQANAGFGNTSYFEFEVSKPLEAIQSIILSSYYLKDTLINIELDGLKHPYPILKLKQ